MSHKDKSNSRKRRRRDSSHSQRRRREKHHKHDKINSKERKNSSGRSSSSPLKSDKSDTLKPGWIEELQRESIQIKANSQGYKDKMNNDLDDNNNKQKSWIKKRGLDYLKEEFIKAEYMKENDNINYLAYLSKVKYQSSDKLEKALDLLQMTQLIISELNDYESLN